MPSLSSEQPRLTPLDREVIDSFASKLQEASVDASVTAAITASYQAARTPSADALLQVLKQAMATPEATE